MNPIEHIASRATQLGEGMIVHRALPTRQRRMVGAWCFLDHAGPVNFAEGDAMRVGAHPHTGLQTFTWLIEGEILHRDSLGNEQIIRPGEVNLMTAGHGIVHTEDSVPGKRLQAAQLWIALPSTAAECPPSFEHFPDLPTWEQDACHWTLLAGSYGDKTAPAAFHSPLVGMDIRSLQKTMITLRLSPGFEYGILPMEGECHIGQEKFITDEFAYLGTNLSQVTLVLESGSRILLLGGEPFEQPITMWWNFVGFSKEYIAQAQKDWENNTPRFGAVKDAESRRLTAPKLPWTT
ncbi:pirin family protein [Undibacterium sp. SXout7W]|uniref:pirin family protein n=1 Tax=Undibacterium sp. SXout7W TaxID=3413049 RepID=UPI003BF4197D